MGMMLDYMEADLALAHAAAGESEVALRHARRVLPRLRALKSEDLLARLRAAIGPALDE